MKINFNHLKFRNIFSYGNKWTEFNFENGIDLVTGKNGNGKSTFVDALTYALFGKPFRKIKLGNLINDKNNKDLLVELEFDVNRRGFKIVRGQKPHIFEIYRMTKDDEWEQIESHSTTRDHQAYLEENILQFGESVFRQLIALGANLSSSKSFMDLSKSEKEEVLQVITDTAIFNQIKEKVKERKNGYKTKETDLKYRSEVLGQSLQTTRINIKAMESQNTEFKNNKDKAIALIKEEIDTKEAKIPQYQKALGAFEDFETHKAELEDQLEPLLEKRDELEAEKKDIESHIRILANNEKNKTVCPNCEFEIKQDLEWTPETLKADFKRVISEIEELSEAIEPLQDEVEEYKVKISNEPRIANNFEVLEKELYELRERLASTEAWEEIVIDYSELERVEKEFEEVKEKLISVRGNLSDLVEVEELVSDKNLKGVILNQQLPFLNRFINEFLELFGSKFNFIIDDKFEDNIVSRSSTNEFNSLSNGQKQRITMSILFAFLKLIEERNGVSTNLLILDEYLDSSLDIDGINEVLRILSEVFSETKDVVLISHNPDIKNRFELISRSFKAVSKDGFSSFEQDSL